MWMVMRKKKKSWMKIVLIVEINLAIHSKTEALCEFVLVKIHSDLTFIIFDEFCL